MIKLRLFFYYTVILFAAVLVTGCNDNDSFSTNYSNILSFKGTDTLSLDTVFSTVPSPHKQIVIYNNSGDVIRISKIIQAGTNQTGFRVNVNGTYLSDAIAYTLQDMELRQGDSIRIFVEMTSRQGKDTIPRLVKDSLIFTLESGRRQLLHLNAWTWDAQVLRNYVVSRDDTLRNEHGMPIVVFGDIKVDSLQTLSVDPGTTVYFHSGAGIDVFGTLKVNGQKDNEVTFRSDRLDRMVSNLMYDNNPGQWKNIRLRKSSFNNIVNFCDIHAGTIGFLCDSTEISNNPKLTLSHSTIHNMRVSGIMSFNGNINIENSQISNADTYCLCVYGGNVNINNSTIVQYYPFDANRGPAMYFANAIDSTSYPLTMNVKNSIVKGYADDVIVWSKGKLDNAIDAHFQNCLLRTPLPPDKDSLMFSGSIYEDVADTLTNGNNSFVQFDTHYFLYDFTPKPGTVPIGNANPATALTDDRKGKARNKEKPDMGCFETDK